MDSRATLANEYLFRSIFFPFTTEIISYCRDLHHPSRILCIYNGSTSADFAIVSNNTGEHKEQHSVHTSNGTARRACVCAISTRHHFKLSLSRTHSISDPVKMISTVLLARWHWKFAFQFELNYENESQKWSKKPVRYGSGQRNCDCSHFIISLNFNALIFSRFLRIYLN